MAENKGFMTGSMWIRSLAEFRKLRVVTFCGMMCSRSLYPDRVLRPSQPGGCVSVRAGCGGDLRRSA